MISPASSIIRDSKETREIDVVDDVIHDYAATISILYIKDQSNLPLGEFSRYSTVDTVAWVFGASRFFICIWYLVDVLGEKEFHALTRVVSQMLRPHTAAEENS